MGLAGPRKRRKIGLDPNNTAWTRAESSYGQKIMSAQGWTPGSYLGARDASHAAHFSAANAAPIRIQPKDDNLGLGARGKGVEHDNFGLRSLHDLYGRLNGKSEATRQVEQSHMTNLNLRLYADNKWGGLNFVKGGLLVGDRIHDNSAQEQQQHGQVVGTGQPEDDEQDTSGDGNHRRDSEIVDDDTLEKFQPDKPGRKSSGEEKTRRKVKQNRSKDTDDNFGTEADNTLMAVPPMSKEQARKERRERKAERRTRREEKRAQRDLKLQKPDTSDQQTQQAAANATGARHAVRQRYIKQKRMSCMDPQALREILMVKS